MYLCNTQHRQIKPNMLSVFYRLIDRLHQISVYMFTHRNISSLLVIYVAINKKSVVGMQEHYVTLEWKSVAGG